MKNSYSYFENTGCEYFPCHKNSGKYFNCLFCYCPLYALGEDCGGNFSYTSAGIKDCSNCSIPHSPNGYDYISSKLNGIIDLAKKDV